MHSKYTAEQPLMLTSFPRYLTENKEMDLNIRDKWDSTPLYYACLCGHLELVSVMNLFRNHHCFVTYLG